MQITAYMHILTPLPWPVNGKKYGIYLPCFFLKKRWIAGVFPLYNPPLTLLNKKSG
jgi:hypothetical protein